MRSHIATAMETATCHGSGIGCGQWPTMRSYASIGEFCGVVALWYLHHGLPDKMLNFSANKNLQIIYLPNNFF